MNLVDVAVGLPGIEERVKPAAGDQIGTEHAVQAGLILGRGNVQDQPLQVGPNQLHALLGGQTYFVDAEHGNRDLAADTSHVFRAEIRAVLSVQLSVVVAVQTDVDRQALRDDAYLGTGVEQKIPHLAHALVRGNGLQKRDIGPDWGIVTSLNLPLGVKHNRVLEVHRVAMPLAGRQNGLPGFVFGEVGYHVEAVQVEPTARPAGHVQRRYPIYHRRHTHDTPRPHHAEVVVGVGEDSGVVKRVADTAATGEIEAVGSRDVHQMIPGHSLLEESTLCLVWDGRVLHVIDRRCHCQHAVGPGVQQKGVENRRSHAGQTIGHQLHGYPGLIQGDVVGRSQLDSAAGEHPPLLEFLKYPYSRRTQSGGRDASTPPATQAPPSC